MSSDIGIVYALHYAIVNVMHYHHHYPYATIYNFVV